MKSVLLGYGTIGKGVEDLVKQTDGLTVENVFVLPEFVDEPYFTNDGIGVVTKDDVDIVFECLSGVEPANTLIRAALENGKHVISSNKAVIAQNLDDYLKLAKEHGGSLQIEASVAGGIPFLDALLKFKKLEDLDGYEGIFNGTSNYILDLMQKEGVSAADALKQAQQMGYAEADPTFDIEGIDAWYKAVISNALAYNSYNPDLRKPLGISKIDVEDIQLAKDNNKIIRHIVSSRQGKDGISTIVAPVFLNPEDYLANIPLNYNAQLIYAPSFEKIGYFGQGAGRYPTAQAMLADAIDTRDGRTRLIEIDEPKEQLDELQTETWLVRSEKDLGGLQGLKSRSENGRYHWFENRDAALIDEVQAIDPDALIALWRD